jgi:alpha-tubulin suppressor-like RCC1 family protein
VLFLCFLSLSSSSSSFPSSFPHPVLAFSLLDLGEIWSWGANESGQLGREGRQSVPQQIDSLQTFAIFDVGCGEDFSVAITETGRLFSWGGNQRGQLGLGDREQKNRPKPLKGLDDKTFIKIACGAKFSVALTSK